ncbi:hypothetical protein RB195_018383 [Necator americanus]|uniref:Uncharacterized protein n=1 Tax=Necator americanus TaxID=51031 RepID=A0ABR1C9I9_NECAM
MAVMILAREPGVIVRKELEPFFITAKRPIMNCKEKCITKTKKAKPDQDFRGDGLPASAEPGLTRDILVSHMSVQLKACNQVTGRCKRGRLESPPTKKATEPESTMMIICTYNARTLASGAPIEHLIMQAKKVKFNVTETKRRHPLKAVYSTGEELFLGTCEYRAKKKKPKLSNMDLEFYREDAFYKALIGDFNVKIGTRRTPEELHIGTHGFQ